MYMFWQVKIDSESSQEQGFIIINYYILMYMFWQVKIETKQHGH